MYIFIVQVEIFNLLTAAKSLLFVSYSSGLMMAIRL
jgi:hypothetical protein